MIINSKKQSLNYILLRKGGDQLYSHKYISKPNLPIITTMNENNQNNNNLFLTRTFLRNFSKFDKDNYMNFNSNDNEKDPNQKTKSLLTETQKMDESIIDIFNNTNKGNLNIKDNSPEPINSFKDFSSNNNSEIKLINNNRNESNKSLKSYNNYNIFTNDFIKNKNSFYNFSSQTTTFKKDGTFNNLERVIEPFNNKKEFKNEIINSKKLKEKNKIKFMKNILKYDKNFLIDDYLKSRNLAKNKKYMYSKDSNRSSYLITNDYNKEKEGKPIFVKDIRIKSLLNDYENKKSRLDKYSPFIIRDNYLKKKFGNILNSFSGINDYELKINIKNDFKNPFKFGNKSVFNMHMIKF